MSVCKARISYLGSFKCIKCSFRCAFSRVICLLSVYRELNSGLTFERLYGVATISRLLESIGLFCKRAL